MMAMVPLPSDTGIFDRIVVGVDGSQGSLVAVEQALRLRGPSSSLTLVCVLDLPAAAAAGMLATRAAEQLEEAAEQALVSGRELAPNAEQKIVHGPPAAALIEECARSGATLLCVGARGASRIVGISFEGVKTYALHESTCAVHVARPTTDGSVFPGSIVVGLDGSPSAELAYATASELSERCGSTLRGIHALGGRSAGEAAAPPALHGAETDPRGPVAALLDAGGNAGLMVLGSRGLHGVSALGSVSERVAHRAACSVLVVRAPVAAP
jgi:nucleotide-binding universal stress UspA family protein